MSRIPRHLSLALLLVSTASVSAQEVLAPEKEHPVTAVTVLQNLEEGHYRKLHIDDAFAQEALDRLLNALDPGHNVFLAADVAAYRREFGTALDDLLRKGDVEPAFRIYNRYRERRLAQLDFFEASLDRIQELDFTVPETLDVDREEAPWPADEEAAADFWRRRFKNDVLVQRLDDKSDEEIRKSLERRYANQRRQLLQTHSRDVFGLYMNIVGGEFDPHTNYFLPLDAESFDIQMSLSVTGIGALLQADGEYTKIQRLIPGGPAEKCGQLEASDRILAVGDGENGEMIDVVGWRTDDVADLIRGEKGTVVRLEVVAPDAPESAKRTVVLTRDRVALEEQAAHSKVVEIERDGRSWKLGVIDLPAFYVDFAAARRGDPDFRSSTRDVAKLLEELEDEGVDGVVMDLRANGGGSLTEAQSLTGLFVGKRPVVQVRSAEGEVQVLGSHGRAVYDGPLVVLVDRLSASASEIFSAAIQDLGRGVVVGSRTFGKGTVQALLPLEYGELKLTRAKFYRVSGGSTQLEGVVPDVDFPSRYDEDDIGESALPDALPWDAIAPVDGLRRSRLSSVIPDLRRLHRLRTAKSPAFRYPIERLAFFEETEARKEVSLVESERRAQYEADEARLLAIENEWRQARGLDPVDDLAKITEGTDEAPDPFVTEAAEILLDLASHAHLASK